jgi:hypothetical protein
VTYLKIRQTQNFHVNFIHFTLDLWLNEADGDNCGTKMEAKKRTLNLNFNISDFVRYHFLHSVGTPPDTRLGGRVCDP